MNDNWFVDTDQGCYFLRQRSTFFTPASIDFELELIEHLMAAGFPTAPLIHTTDGARRVEHDGRHWELYGFVEGEPFRVENLAQTRSAAALLARFHEAVANFRPRGEVPPDRRVDLRQAGQMIDEFEAELTAEAGALGRVLAAPLLRFFRRQAELVLAGSQAIAGAPPTLIHGDFQPTNVLFRGDQAVALLDFGDASLFHRAYDVARAILRFATLRPGYRGQTDMAPRLDWPRARAFAQAYQEAQPLSDAEREAIPALLRGAYLFDVSFFLEKESSPLKQIAWLIHAWRFTRWLDGNEDTLPTLF
jgi:homoserine kinase type II